MTKRATRGTLWGAWLTVSPVLTLFACGDCTAQYRADQREVLSPPAPPAPVQGVAESFKLRYRAAGNPRVMLFWNVSLDDSTEAVRQHFERTQSSNYRMETAFDSTAGGETVERVMGSRTVDSAKRENPLSAVDAAQLEGGFRHALQAADVRLVNRNFSIRMTKAAQDRGAADSKLIESDAVSSRAEWLLEVLIVPDAAAPLGVGFTVTLTDIKAGTDQISFYTNARHALAPMQRDYVATSTGYERRPAPEPDAAADIGAELAREVIESLRLMLAAA